MRQANGKGLEKRRSDFSGGLPDCQVIRSCPVWDLWSYSIVLGAEAGRSPGWSPASAAIPIALCLVFARAGGPGVWMFCVLPFCYAILGPGAPAGRRRHDGEPAPRPASPPCRDRRRAASSCAGRYPPSAWWRTASAARRLGTAGTPGWSAALARCGGPGRRRTQPWCCRWSCGPSWGSSAPSPWAYCSRIAANLWAGRSDYCQVRQRNYNLHFPLVLL